MSEYKVTPEDYMKVAEADRYGVKQHEAGAKLDAGKPMCALVLGDFSRALMKVAEVGTFGATKYTPHGWLSVQDGISRYADAGMRHKLKYNMGEIIDPDSKLEHKAHEAWNILAEYELMLRENEKQTKERNK